MASEEKDTEIDTPEKMQVDQKADEATLQEEDKKELEVKNDIKEDATTSQHEEDIPMEDVSTELKEDETSKKEDAETPENELNEPEEEKEEEPETKANEGTEAENTETDNEEETDLKRLYPESYQNAASGSRRLRINFRPVSDESDGEYKSDDNEIKKTIMVGSDYQAQIPEEFSKYDDALPYENKDKLVWDGCNKLSEAEILGYLRKVRTLKYAARLDTLDPVTQQLLEIPTGKHVRDDEHALFLLQQCGHDIVEALRRIQIAAAPPEETMSAWSEEECRNFETGLRLYGKNFHQIQLSKVKTRSVGEIVQFYYLWKKSERHDVFASKARLDKKKYSLNPGQCIMDRFLEDQDGTSNVNNDTNDVQQQLPRNIPMPMCV